MNIGTSRIARTLAILLALAWVGGSPARADSAWGWSSTAMGDEEERDRAAKRKKKGTGKKGKSDKSSEAGDAKPFEEVIKDFEVHEGLFNLYTKDDKTYLEILPDQYDKVFLLSMTRVGGIGQYFPLLGNQMMFQSPAVEFRRVGKKVHLLYKNVYFHAGTDKAMQRTVARSFSDSLFGSAKQASAAHPDRKSDLIDIAELLIRDVDGVENFTQQALQSPYKLDRKHSSLGRLRAFPENVEIETVVHFTNARPRTPMMTLVDSRSMFLRYHFSFSEIPEDDSFVPRLADDRIGHIVAPFGDFSEDNRSSPYGRYVTRWKLEKADPLLEVSPVKEPVVWYLDPTIPAEYRGAVRDGILVWNNAFEHVGLKNALVVKDAPVDDPDWDSADVRYSTVRWFVDVQGAFAIGPSRANPFTGQIYEADISFSDGITRFARNEWREQVDPLTRFRSATAEARHTARHGWERDTRYRGPQWSVGSSVSQCNLGEQLVEHAAFGHALLSLRGMVPDSVEERKYLRDMMVHITAHEVGHTLGLRHNYRASTIHAVEDLHNAGKTKERGLTGSVMDYIAVNIAPQGVEQGQYWQTTLGPYDYWAIEYAYTITSAERPRDELKELGRIASRAPDRNLAYSTDEDAVSWTTAPLGMDPRANTWDLGADPLAYYADRVKLTRELWSKLPGDVIADGEGYQVVRRAFNRALGEYFPAIRSVTKYVGGVQHNRHHAGDPGGSTPYEPVDAAEQRRALAWLHENLFGPDAFAFDPELVLRLAAERFGAMSGFIFRPRLDYPIHNTVLAMQDMALARLYHPALLDRVLDMETKVNGGDVVDMAELFGSLRDGIWSEVSSGSSASRINSYRRALQRRHLEYLVDLATDVVAMAPAESRTLARFDLMELQKRIGQALEGFALDASTRAHLSESKAITDHALEAAFVRSNG